MNTPAPLAPLEDACTVVLLRDGQAGVETLMLERPHTSRAFGGAWVFPGGKIDPEDRVDLTGAVLDELTAAQVAGLREVAEETGQLLNRKDLVWLSQWTPMQRIPRRFRTWFMLARATPADVVINPHEHSKAAWLSPTEALARHSRGEMLLIPPTWVTLYQLAAADTVAQALEDARNSQPFSYNTHVLPHGSTDPAASNHPAGVLWLGDEDYPGMDNPQPAPGARHRLTTTCLPWVFEQTRP